MILRIEMSPSELACRLAASQTGLDLHHLSSGRLSDQQWGSCAEAKRELQAIANASCWMCQVGSPPPRSART